MKVRLKVNGTKRPLAWLIVVPSLILLCLLAGVPLDWRDQAIFGASLVAAAIFLNRGSRSQVVTMALMVLSMFSTVRYATWRVTETWRYLDANGLQSVGTDLIFVMLLLGAECYAVVILLLGYFQAARPLQRKPEPLPEDPAEWPTIDIFVPTYNEPLDVVRATVLGAMNIDWPQEKRKVYILDDGTRPEFEEFANEAGAGYIIRARHQHAKAGNINNALQQTDGEYVVIFDADHVAARSFLQMTMGWFLKDPKLAMMQTPHHFYSPDPFERNLNMFRKAPNEGALFYGILQDGNDFWNATFFCGSCAVIRRTALMEVGGIAVETVTEDAHTSLRLQMRGWNTAYLAVPQAAGLATANLAEHIGQRIRWSRGMVQILRLENPLFAKGLKLPQRLCYFNAVAHFLFAAPRLIFLTAPVLYLLFGISNIFGYVVAIIAYAAPHLLLATITNSRIQGKYRLSFWNEIYETVLSPYILLPTLAALVSPRWGKFNVTPKSTKVDRSFQDWRVSAPYVVLVLLIVAAIVNGWLRMETEPGQAGTIWVNIAWCVTNLITLGGAIAVANERAQRRGKARIEKLLKCEVQLEGIAPSESHTVNISESGLALQAPVGCKAQPGDRGTVRFALIDGPVEIPMEVMGLAKGTLRAQFPSTSLADAEAVTRVVYGRADAWLDWKTGPDDRPLVSLAQILWVSLCGFAGAIKALFTGRQRAIPVAGLVIAGALLITARMVAQTPSEFSDASDLRSLGLREPLLIHGVEGQATAKFQVPVTKVTTEASIDLHFRPSAAIHGEGFRLQVTLNGVEVALLPARPGDNGYSAVAKVALPSDLLLSENLLAFRVTAACAPRCEEQIQEQDTYIDLATVIRLRGVLLPLANDLRLLPSPFFDPSSRYRTRLPFVLAADADNKTMEAAGVLASWFGVLADHRGMHFPVSEGSIPAGNAVVLARHGSPIAATLGLSGSGPMVAVRDNPSDPHGKLLILMGADGEQLLAAAKAVVLKSGDLQGDTAMVAVKEGPAARGINDAPRWVNTQRPIELGNLTTADSLRLVGNGTSRMYFRLPPDLHFGFRATAPLRVSYRFTGVTAAKATIQVRLNGVQISLLTLASKENDKLKHAAIQVPVSLLYPRNTLDIEFRHPVTRGSARAPQVQILSASALDLTDVPNFTELPRLDLFSKAGFPFTRTADLGNTAVLLPANATPELVALYLDLMGFFGAQTGHAALRVSVIDAHQAGDAGRDLLVIGSGRDSILPTAWTDAAPLQEVGGGFAPAAPNGLFGRLERLGWTRAGREQNRLAEMLASDAPELALQMYASPVGGGRSVVTISPVSTGVSEAFVDALATAAGTSEINGSVSLYRNGKFHSFLTSRGDYFLGTLGYRELFNYQIARRFALLPVLIVLLAVMLGRFASNWVERKAALRVQA